MAVAKCAHCLREAEIPTTRPNGQGHMLMPDGWSNVQVTGAPIVNKFLCPEHTAEIQQFLGS